MYFQYRIFRVSATREISILGVSIIDCVFYPAGSWTVGKVGGGAEGRAAHP